MVLRHTWLARPLQSFYWNACNLLLVWLQLKYFFACYLLVVHCHFASCFVDTSQSAFVSVQRVSSLYLLLPSIFLLQSHQIAIYRYSTKALFPADSCNYSYKDQHPNHLITEELLHIPLSTHGIRNIRSHFLATKSQLTANVRMRFFRLYPGYSI